MNEIEMRDILGKLQDIRDDIYILGNTKKAKADLENLIKELDLKIAETEVNGVVDGDDQALDKHDVSNSVCDYDPLSDYDPVYYVNGCIKTS